ncbi:uncharacterized protein LOC143214869 isoform X2 [Lasioglossum baleicum]|uniref:uncharacterized protein LOC143214869 isoform X2 n=1 Tax=Lasioglossum baleicum TaxID=434251 RepID=UPI003FCC7AF7
MNTKRSPRKVTLAMIKGKPITTSVPVIHFHASDDELEEIYPSTDEEKRLTPDFERISSKLTSSPQKCTEKRSTQESDITESNSECRSISAENVIPEGTPPSLDPWKMLSNFKGKITKTFEEKLSEIKSDKKKSGHTRAESSSISDSEDQGNVTPCDDKTGNDKQTNEPTTNTVLRRTNPDESVESGVEASEFSPETDKDPASFEKSDTSLRKSSDTDNFAGVQKQTSYIRSTVSSTKTNFKVVFSHLLKQLACQLTYRSVAALVAVFCIYYVTPLPEYLIGLVTGIVATVIFYDTVTRFKTILTNLPDDTFANRQVVPVLEIPAVEEHAVVERFQGWLNELPYRYEPSNYHVARTKSVFFRLEGSILRIMESRIKVPKKAVWDETQQKLKFVKKRVYNLSGGKVELVPCGLARRRRWSKKYPICITLKRKQAHVCNVMLKAAMNDECYSTSNGQGDTILESKEGESKEKQGNEEEKHVDEAEVLLEEEEEDTAELDDDEDDVETFHSDFDNDEFDNEYVEYKRRVLEDGTVEDTCKRSIKKNGKNRINNRRGGEKKNDSTTNGNANKCHSCGYSFVERRKKKCRMILKQVKFRKRSNSETDGRSKVDEERGRLAKEGTDRYENKEAQKREEGDGEEEFSDDNDQDEDDDDEDEDDDEDDEDYYYDNDDYDEYNDNESDEVDEDDDEMEDDENETLEDKRKMREIKIEFESLEGEEEKEEKREGAREKEKEEEKDEWETIDGAGGGQKNSRKRRRNSRRLRNRIKIYVFARADREKEDWYRRLASASTRRVKNQDASSCFTTDASSTLNTTLSAQRTVTTESKLSASTSNSFENVPELTYNAYMAKHLENNGSIFENEHSPYTDNTFWINCLIARILFDVHRCPETVNLIQDKIQRKLSSIKLPYFMECLLVSEVAIGQGSPIIRNATKPMTNERGLWIDFDITYKGSLTMTVETKLNLMKLTRTGTISGGSSVIGGGGDSGAGGNIVDCPEKDKTAAKSPIFDSDMEDTPETSTEDDDSSQLCSPAAKETTPSTQSSGRKFLSIVDRIAANKYFQHATELSYVRRAMEGVSNTEIRLMVTVSSIEGCLSLNIPPAPSDRLWYGFKPVPKVTLTVKPAVGERAVNFAYITKWIEDKLLREFEKLVVLPNMDDLVLPLCPNYPYTSTR